MRLENWDIGICDVLLRKYPKKLVRHFQVDSRNLSGEEKYSFPRGSYGSLFFTKLHLLAILAAAQPKISTFKIAFKSQPFRPNIAHFAHKIITIAPKRRILTDCKLTSVYKYSHPKYHPKSQYPSYLGAG